jgi:hypothetical protein
VWVQKFPVKWLQQFLWCASLHHHAEGSHIMPDPLGCWRNKGKSLSPQWGRNGCSWKDENDLYCDGVFKLMPKWDKCVSCSWGLWFSEIDELHLTLYWLLIVWPLLLNILQNYSSLQRPKRTN